MKHLRSPKPPKRVVQKFHFTILLIEVTRALRGLSAIAERLVRNAGSPRLGFVTRRPASADRTARCQFQTVFPVITSSFPTNVIAHLHGLSMDLAVGRTVGPTVDSTVG